MKRFQVIWRKEEAVEPLEDGVLQEVQEVLRLPDPPARQARQVQVHPEVALDRLAARARGILGPQGESHH